MTSYLQFVVLGLAAGSVYAALANGLIAVYRATGILNFAQGAIASWGAYVYTSLRSSGDLVLPVGGIRLGALGLWPCVAIGACVSLLIGLVAHLLIFRPLRHAPALAKVVASVGMMIALQALIVLRFGSDAIYPANILPSGTVHVAGANLSETALCLAGIAVVFTAAMYSYLRFTRVGIAARAGAEDERSLRLLGISPDRLAAVMLGASTALGGLMVTLASPVAGLNPIIYTTAVVPALAVALVGRLESVGTACAAGLALGAFQSLVTFLTLKTWWPKWAVNGVQDAVPFVVIVAALFLLGGRLPARGTLGRIQLPRVTIPRLKPLPVATCIAASVLALLFTSGNYRFGVMTSIIVTLLAVSYVLLTGYLGQMSLAQLAFAGTAGFALSKLTTDWHLPFPLSVLAAAAIAAALGVAVGLPAVRIRGAHLAVVTLALAVAAESFVFSNPSLTPLSGNNIADPRLFGVDIAVRSGTEITRLPFCFMVLVVVLITMLPIAWLMRGNTGRVFLAVRSNERAAASVGINVARAKLAGFAISAFIAGVAGALLGYSRGQLSAESFTALGGLSLLAVVYLGGIGSLAGAMIAGLIGPLGVVYVFLTQTVNLGQYYALITGLGLIVTAIFNPLGMAGATRAMVDRLLAWTARRLRSPDAIARLAESAMNEEVIHAG